MGGVQGYRNSIYGIQNLFTFCILSSWHTGEKTHSEKARKDTWYLVSCKIIFKRLVSAAASITKLPPQKSSKSGHKLWLEMQLHNFSSHLHISLLSLHNLNWGSLMWWLVFYEKNISHNCSNLVQAGTIPERSDKWSCKGKVSEVVKKLKLRLMKHVASIKYKFHNKICKIWPESWIVWLLVIWNVYKMCQNLDVKDVTGALVNGSCWNILRCGGG